VSLAGSDQSATDGVPQLHRAGEERRRHVPVRSAGGIPPLRPVSECLDSAYTHSQAPNFVDALWKKKFFILKAHGDVDHKTEMILTERDYRDIIFRSAGYQSALSAIFTTKSILFLGASLSDPETRMLLAFLHDAFHGSGARHYALVSKSEFSETLASRWRKDYKVELLTYEPTTGRPEIAAFLTLLIPPAKD
jgi:hypothetical protein